ncbi:flagellar export chaperone FliS [Paenarthrobacter nitroguajacolicus]|uniref:Flagellar export chaperone FliS n=1 Tax=Paenarthrobacter nitroguajacolicus TaxID=211146 RepID=A0A558GS35_PAENT|nr:flagellar export chaperone FliS [Paenarthrobacter nitroguajacolicus]TVU59695.1 flagellar export chaperone FliS [Paenarthrobacter nitroguajacolicus]
MTYSALRAQQLSRYNDDAVLSAPPARLLTMLYDRLLLDLKRAQLAQESTSWDVARENLLHAQAIVAELRATLRTDAWDGAASLASIYDYSMEALIGANIYRDVERTKECIELLEPLRQGWHEAAAQLSAETPATAVPSGRALGVA